MGIRKRIGFNVSALKEEAELRPAEKRRASKRERERVVGRDWRRGWYRAGEGAGRR